MFLAGLFLIAFSLPVSPFGVSLGTIIVLGNWLLEGDFNQKKSNLFSRPGLIVFSSIFLLCLAGLINTTNFSYAWHDIVIKAPILVLPILIGTSDDLNSKELKIIIAGMLLGLWAATLSGFVALLGYLPVPVNNIRNISLFISHIRLALLLGLALPMLLWFLLTDEELSGTEKAFCLASIFWFSFFLFVLKAVTGFLMLGLFFIILLIFLIRKTENFMLKYFIIILAITGVLFSATWITHATDKFNMKDPPPQYTADTRTMNGNRYDEPHNLTETENGHYIRAYLCEKELKKAWNHASKLSYNEKDHRNQELHMTLIRYMTSKGLRKDSAGFSRMSTEDIQNVENGLTNYLFADRFSLYPYFYRILWELSQYKNGNISGHSYTQRLAYLKTGWFIVKDHFWFGVGTGDVPDMFEKYYQKDHTRLSPAWRLRAHNQYLTYWITYGIFGFVYFLFAFFSPLLWEKKQNDFLAVIFLLIAALSMLYEDTLETQAGVYFVVFFYSLLIFGRNHTNKRKIINK